MVKKKTHIITNILIRISLIAFIYYILNLSLNSKTFDVWLSLSLRFSLCDPMLWITDAYHVGMTMSLWSLNFPCFPSHTWRAWNEKEIVLVIPNSRLYVSLLLFQAFIEEITVTISYNQVTLHRPIMTLGWIHTL